MTLQEAIIHAKEKSKTLSGKCAQEHLQLAEWLEELQCLRKSNNWIPASVRLPGPFETVLITVQEEGVQEPLVYEGGIGAGDIWSVGGVAYHMKPEDIKAWMPLPEPYKED